LTSQALRLRDGDLLPPAVSCFTPARRDASGALWYRSASWTTRTISRSQPGGHGSAAASPKHGVWSALALGRRHSRLPNRPSDQLHTPRVRHRLPCSPISPVCVLVDTALAGREWMPGPGARSWRGSCATGGHGPLSSSAGPSASRWRGRTGSILIHPRSPLAGAYIGRDGPGCGEGWGVPGTDRVSPEHTVAIDVPRGQYLSVPLPSSCHRLRAETDCQYRLFKRRVGCPDYVSVARRTERRNLRIALLAMDSALCVQPSNAAIGNRPPGLVRYG
jgi:hypothetical protein